MFCDQCGYNLSGRERLEPICPECGSHYDPGGLKLRLPLPPLRTLLWKAARPGVFYGAAGVLLAPLYFIRQSEGMLYGILGCWGPLLVLPFLIETLSWRRRFMADPERRRDFWLACFVGAASIACGWSLSIAVMLIVHHFRRAG